MANLHRAMIPRMPLHRTSGRARLGLALALTTMLLWALLPIALKALVADLDVFTLTWARFLASALLLGAWLALRRSAPPLASLDARGAALLATAAVFLAANYGCFLVGLHWTSAADAGVLIQVGPILLSLGGIVVFREAFSRLQWWGLAVLAAGVLTFVGSRLGGPAAGARLEAGLGMIGLAAVTWAVYGLAQKQLLHHWSSNHVLWCVYVGCALVFTPLASPSALAPLDGVAWGLLVFCTLNTLVAYGCFAESLAHWEASRVGAVLALTPLATLAIAAAIDAWAPGWGVGQALAWEGWLGAVLVVAGSLAASLGARGAR